MASDPQQPMNRTPLIRRSSRRRGWRRGAQTDRWVLAEPNRCGRVLPDSNQDEPAIHWLRTARVITPMTGSTPPASQFVAELLSLEA